VVLSTDSPQIAEVGRRCGIEVPFLRPADLALDHTPTIDVVRHTLEWFAASGETWDAVCLLQPTNPFRQPDEIDGSVRLFVQSEADCVITVRPIPAEFHPHWAFFQKGDGGLCLWNGTTAPSTRRQDLVTAFYRTGSVYITRSRVVLDEQSLYGGKVIGYVVENGRSVNLDSPEDWLEAERVVTAWQAAQTISA
jgi:CMP-N,N'-diacetyllegionaminic acid synthase